MHLEVAVYLPRESITVALVRTVVTNTLTVFGVDDDCIEDIRLALSEACTNVVMHATGDEEYEVQVRIDDDRCAISVRNTGDEFDPESLNTLLTDTDSPRGRGVPIMRAVMDEVSIESTPPKGTVVTLSRRLRLRWDAPLRQLRGRGA